MLSAAQRYEKVHRGNPGDLAFYRWVCDGAQHVLELGCGTGRVLEALAAPERALTGVDSDEAKLALARVCCPGTQLIQADMRTFAIDALFDRILVPYNGLYCLGGEAGIRAALRAAAAHLKPEGELVFDVYAFEEEDWTGFPTEAEVEPLFTFATGDDMAHVGHRMVKGAGQQELVATTHWQADEVTAVDEIRHHFLFRDQLLDLFPKVGLRVVEERGGFDGQAGGEDVEIRVFRLGHQTT